MMLLWRSIAIIDFLGPFFLIVVLRIIAEPITLHPADVAIVLALSTLADPVVSDGNTNVTGNSFGLADLLRST
jgi:hypothetical protein